MANKVPKPAVGYPGDKVTDLPDPYTTKTVIRSYEGKNMASGKDNYLSGGKGQRTIKGEGQSGPSGGKMSPKKALEPGGHICTGGEYNAGSTYGKMGKTKTPSFKTYDK